MKKRIISCILSLVLLLSVSPVMAADTTPFEPSIYGKEVKFLQDMGFLDEPVPDTDAVTMTRAEFVTLVLKALGYDKAVLSGSYTQVFDDVTPKHKSYSYIMYAYNCGLFNGESATVFNPDGELSMNQAITVAIKMLGYQHHAEAMGSWPAGYVSMANSLKLLDGVNATDNWAAAHKSWIYVLLYNTLHTDMLIYTGVGEDLNYEIIEGRNILTENHNITILEGIVTSVGDVSINGKLVKDGYFCVDSVNVKNGTASAEGMLGKRVVCYAKEEGSDLVAAVIGEDGNLTFTVTADQIESFQYTSGVYKIIDGDKTRDIKIGNDYHLIYNGSKITGSIEALMLPQTGSVTLTDNDEDNVYEIVEVEEYYNMVVSYYDSYKNTLYDRNPSEPTPGSRFERNVALDDYEQVVSNTPVSEIPTGSVVSVFKSLDGKKVRLELAEISASGAIDEISSSGGFEVVIGDISYKISNDARFDTASLRAGTEVTALCDVYGKIAYITSRSSYLSGYVLEFSNPAAAGLGSQSVNILTASGTPQAYTLASKVKIRTSSGSQSYASQNLAPQFGTNSREFVLYVTNDNREITEFIFPLVINTKAEFDNPPDYPLYKMNYFLTEWPGGTTSSKQFREEINGFDNWLVFDSNANVFTVPGEAEPYSESTVDVSKISSFTNKSYKQLPADITADRVMGEFDVYKVGSAGVLPNVMVNYAAVSAKPIQEDSTPAVVTDIRNVVDTQSGDAVTSISMLEGSSKREYKVRDDVSLTFGGIPLGVGDVIKCATDSEGYIARIELYYSNSTDTLLSNPQENYNSIDLLCRLAYGEVVRNESGYLEMELSYDGNTKFERYSINNMRTLIVSEDRTGIHVDVATSASIAPGDKIIIYSRYLRNSLIIAYKEA